ncbi:MAG: hypothetical protein AB1564_06555 [Chloroflexota bacterium]
MPKIGNAILITLLALILTATPVLAADAAEITVIRLNDHYIGIKIVFPTDISGHFSGFINQKHFDCLTLPPRTLFCIGPLDKSERLVTLYLYSHDLQEIVLEQPIEVGPHWEGEPADKPSCIECEPQ